MADAGFQKGADGVLRRNGKPFEFTILLNPNSVRFQCAEIIQRRLSEIGIQAKLRVIEWASFINEFIDKKNFEAVILGWTIPQSDPDLFDIFHSSKQGFKELNFVSFSNPEVDELLVKARHIFNQTERKRCYDRVQEILAEEQPYTFLFIPYATLAVHKRFKGIEPAPAGITYNIEKWYVPEAQRRYKINAAISP